MLFDVKSLFPDVKWIPAGKCPVCGEEKYHCVGFIQCGDERREIDKMSECSCDIERFRKNNDLRASMKVNQAIKEKVIKECGFRESEKKLIDKAFRGKLKEKYDKCMEYASYFSQKTEKGKLIQGDTGTGKTMTAVHMIKKVLDKGYIAKFVTASDLYNIYMASYTNRDLVDQIESYKTCDLLCLDDLGAEYTNNDAIHRMNEVIDYRLGQGKPTIITTNLDDRNISQRYGQRLLSRIHESFSKILFVGEDMRY